MHHKPDLPPPWPHRLGGFPNFPRGLNKLFPTWFEVGAGLSGFCPVRERCPSATCQELLWEGKGKKRFFHSKKPRNSPTGSIQGRIPPGGAFPGVQLQAGLLCTRQNVPGLTALILIKGFMTKCEEEAEACAELRIIWSGYF